MNLYKHLFNIFLVILLKGGALMNNKRKGRKELKITFINPNTSKSFEELLKTAIIEKIKNSNKYQLTIQ
jgi:hypothetical protein